MTQSMIERVARAILQCDIGTGEPLVCQLAFIIDDPKLSAAIIARAAIEAMREPTPEMVDILRDERRITHESPCRPYITDSDMQEGWRAAIDAALKEGE